MALHTLPMQILLNKRISRTFFFALLLLLTLSLAGFWSASPRLTGGHGLALPSWLGGSTAPEFYPYETTSQFFPVSMDIASKTTKDLCASFPSYLTSRIQPVLKMGHGESRDKIEAQLDSVSACFTDAELLIFSDLDETIRGRTVIDILADLPQAYHLDNPDFENYLTMQAMRRNGTLDVDKNATKAINGWRLDKYKFLPGLERAWAMRPGRDWYVFYETDTYVVWDNMFRFLSTLDPSRPHYLGSPSPGRVDKTMTRETKTWFANGGPGYVLSRAAIEALLARKVDAATGRYVDPPLTLRWLDLLRADCCGDSVMGWTLWNISVPLGGYWPMFNPHSLQGMPYSDLYWCQPVITMHKTTPGDMVDLWRWEHSRRLRDKPLLYQDLWSFRHPGGDAQLSLLKDWDNGGWAEFKPPADRKISSAAECRTACDASDRCLQYLWKGLDVQECVLMFQIRYGVPRKPDTVKEPEPEREKEPDGTVKQVAPPPAEKRVDYTSGWMTERIGRWREERPCEVVQWVGPSITRVF